MVQTTSFREFNLFQSKIPTKLAIHLQYMVVRKPVRGRMVTTIESWFQHTETWPPASTHTPVTISSLAHLLLTPSGSTEAVRFQLNPDWFWPCDSFIGFSLLLLLFQTVILVNKPGELAWNFAYRCWLHFYAVLAYKELTVPVTTVWCS